MLLIFSFLNSSFYLFIFMISVCLVYRLQTNVYTNHLQIDVFCLFKYVLTLILIKYKVFTRSIIGLLFGKLQVQYSQREMITLQIVQTDSTNIVIILSLSIW